MERLTTDNPQGNFSTFLNYVFEKDGWAYIRSDGESEGPILLTEWARKQCITRGCDELPTDPEGIDESISDCAFCAPTCPVFLAYTFACQAVHLRDRLKLIEDILGDDYGPDHLKELVQAENDGRLVVLPCKVGDTVFAAETSPVIPLSVVDVGMYLEGTDGEDWEALNNFGKTVFLTREEAEAALAEKGAET